MKALIKSNYTHILITSFCLVFACCKETTTENNNSKELSQEELDFFTETIYGELNQSMILVSKIEEVSEDKVLSILKEEYKLKQLNDNPHNGKEYQKIISKLSDDHNMSQKKVSSIIYRYKVINETYSGI